MRLEFRGRPKVNGAADLQATVAIFDEDKLVFEDVVQLSRSKSREAFIGELADRAKISTDKAREAVLDLIEDHRKVVDVAPVTQSTPGQERKADKLVREFLRSGVELFHDQVDVSYAAVPDKGRRAIYRVRSAALKNMLSFISFTRFDESASSETVNSAVSSLEGMAQYDGLEYRLNVRTAWHEGAIYYDLGDWRAVKITQDGWDVEERPPILFKRFTAQKPQVEPESGGELLELLPLINIQEQHLKLLYVSDLVAGLIPEIPRPVSVFHGPQGSAKSTALRYKRELTDPSEVPFLTMPKDVDAFAQAGSHNLCLFYDNVTSLPQWLADCLSRFCTGDGSIKRTLFTDDDDFIFKSQGIGGIAGINLVVNQPDLLDRSFVFEMRRVDDKNRLEEKVLDARFEVMKPKLLGAMFEALSGAMAVKDLIHPSSLPRLADYAVWGCAVALDLGFSEDQYWRAIENNSQTQSTEALDASTVAQAVVAFMHDKTAWQGSPSDLLNSLNSIAAASGIDTGAKSWPKDPSWVTKRLNRVVPNLAQVDIIFEVRHEGRRRMLSLLRGEAP